LGEKSVAKRIFFRGRDNGGLAELDIACLLPQLKIASYFVLGNDSWQ
jgi:hypothetical protein